MERSILLIIFILLRFAQYLIEETLSFVNRRFYLNGSRQKEAQKILAITEEDLGKTLSYANDRFWFARLSEVVGIIITLGFIGFGGLGLFEKWAILSAGTLPGGKITVGLLFFVFLGLANMIIHLPFDLYNIFKIEEKHGFNKQTLGGFFLDRLKGLVIGIILGGILLGAVLFIMEKAGSYWWVYAWAAVTGFSFFTVWIYPAVLAPLFNKFSPLQEGGLKDNINSFSEKVGFRTSGIFVMDASKRSTHGNAYFTGLAGKKRIVLFDTLMESMTNSEILAVLAHELGHFKLHHIRWQLVRGTLMTGMMFFLLSLALPLSDFYLAFYLQGVSNYGALIVFGMWFGVLDFALQPIENYLSRRNEFAADRFATVNLGEFKTLGQALLKLREKSHSVPLSHPLYSKIYYSHPPLLERLRTMGYI